MNEEPQPQSKSKGKKGSLWPWLVAIGGGSILYYFHRKKKTTEAKAREGQLQAQTRVETQPRRKGQGNHPGLKISPNNRLRAIMDQEE